MHSMDAKCFFLLRTAPDSGKSLLGEFIARLCDLYERYKEYCSINHIQPETQILLGKRVKELPGICKTKSYL